MTDPIADMLTRLRNSLAVNKTEVSVPYSKIKLAIADILKKNDYISDYKRISDNHGEIKIVLKYDNGKSKIVDLKRISKPGRRIYVAKDEIPKVLNSLGISIISTSQGVITGKEAKKRVIGGEVLCEIY